MTRGRSYFAYIMSNKSRRFYTGHTEDLHKRVIEHKQKLLRGFTSRYVFDRRNYPFRKPFAFGQASRGRE